LGKWPAVDVTHRGEPDLTLAIVDDFTPTAVEPRDNALRIFFQTATARDAACAVLSAARYRAAPVDVDDEDWARRSQEDLKPIIVGLLTIVPSGSSRTCHPAPSTSHPALGTAPGTRHPAPATIVIQPSIGFGTGHHATTRICLRALQAVDVVDRLVLDVGTGSGVLAIAAVRLGAARAVGIDHDADAIQAANENLTLNEHVEAVEFQSADLSAAHLPAADVVTANLTGAVLIRSAARLLDLVRPGGTLIVSGLLEEERDDVVDRFAGPYKVRPTPEVGRILLGPPLTFVREQHEEGWVALAMKRS
jgi:ribosomal protein L11 methyltransferase